MISATKLELPPDVQAKRVAGSSSVEKISQLSSTQSLGEQLKHIEDFLRQLDGPAVSAAGTVSELRQCLTAGRLHLAVLGQFKRGKSTLQRLSQILDATQEALRQSSESAGTVQGDGDIGGLGQ
jgi:hypothetical protein